MHEILVVTTVNTEIKHPDFHFFKKECPFIYAIVQFDLVFFNSEWYENTLNTQGVILSFSLNKIIKLLDLKA